LADAEERSTSRPEGLAEAAEGTEAEEGAVEAGGEVEAEAEGAGEGLAGGEDSFTWLTSMSRGDCDEVLFKLLVA
jgi:hypothetical protein